MDPSRPKNVRFREAAPPNEGAHRVLDVLSLNVWGLPWPVSRARTHRFGRILEHLGKRTDHIVGLQELWGRTHRLLHELAPLLPHAAGDSGLALAGGLRPAERPRVHHFSTGRGPDRLKHKGVLEGVVELAGLGEVRVLVTHLQAGRRHAGIRARQVEELLETAAKSSVATVLMGDFNLYSGEPRDEASAGLLEREGFADAALETGNPQPTFASNNPFVGRAVAERFDRVFLRSGRGLRLSALRTEVLDTGPVFSDHHPVWARLALRRVRD